MRTDTYDPSAYRLISVEALKQLFCLIDPPPTEIGGATRVFRNPNAADTLTKLSASIRSMVEHALPAPTPPDTGAGDAEDAARLDWILRHTPGDALRYSVGELADTADLSEFRAAIDAAMRASEVKT